MTHIQTKVNEKLTEMDRTIKIVHEGKTLNDTSIQLLIKRMDIFGAQMLLLHKLFETPENDNETPNRVHTTGNNTLNTNGELSNTLDSIGDNIENEVMTPIDIVLGTQGDEDTAWEKILHGTITLPYLRCHYG